MGGGAPDFADTSERADTGPGGVSWRAEEDFQTSTSGRRSDWPLSRGSPRARSVGNWASTRICWAGGVEIMRPMVQRRFPVRASHATSPRQDRQLVLQVVLMALWQRTDRSPVVLHADRGCQFTSDECQRFLKGHQIRSSMSAVGTCADNAAAESFFGLLKRERVNRRQYRTRAEARADVFDYIERFHNPRRAR